MAIQFESDIPKCIIDEMSRRFAFEPADWRTARDLGECLSLNWPEARWHVGMIQSDLLVGMSFQKPEERTMFLLRYV